MFFIANFLSSITLGRRRTAECISNAGALNTQAKVVIFALSVLASQIIHGTEGNPEWAKKSLDEIEIRVSMIASFVSLGNEMNTPNIERQ